MRDPPRPGRPDRTQGPHRGAAGRGRVRGAGAGRPTSTTCSPIPPRSSSRSTASPTRRTSARCCAPPRPPARPASCSPTHRAVGPHARRWPRRPPARSSTCRSRSCRAFPARSTGPKRAGVWCVGLDADGDQSLLRPRGRRRSRSCSCSAPRAAACRGSPVQRCDVVASIPMHGHLESLNVSAAAAVACTEIARRRDGIALFVRRVSSVGRALLL